MKRIDVTNTINGEWFLPHVVEPAFGLDRIMWHIIDHAYYQQEKKGLHTIHQVVKPDHTNELWYFRYLTRTEWVK